MKLSLIVFLGLTLFELAMASVDTTTQPLERTGRPFRLQGIAAGTVITQRFEVRASGLEEIRLDGGISAGSGPAVLRAQLGETDPQGAVIKVVRTGSVSLAAGQTDCCVVRFEPIPDSRWRAYRLDLIVSELNGRLLSLRLAPGEEADRLTVNGRFERAVLVFRARAAHGNGLERLHVTSDRKGLALALLALFYNAAVATAVHLFANASGPRRA